jgi:hypothetical protein
VIGTIVEAATNRAVLIKNTTGIYFRALSIVYTFSIKVCIEPCRMKCDLKKL